MGVLMYFHFTHFRQGGLFSSREEEELAYVTIMPHELHRFDTDEVDANSVTDRSSYIGTIKDDSEQANLTGKDEAELIPPKPDLNPSLVGNSRESGKQVEIV